MVARDPPQRIPQITDAERSDDVRRMFDAMHGVSRQNNDHNPVLKTFARHPALTQKFLAFNAYLLSASNVPVRLRQIAILRVAWLKRCRYMWSSHLRMSLRLGLTETDFRAVPDGATSAHWSADERLVLDAVAQLCEQSDLDDAHWNALSAIFDQKTMLDFVFTVGGYVALAMVFNSIRIEREAELVELAERYGCPG
jgi:alkylhydroperoxidase family enzyme